MRIKKNDLVLVIAGIDRGKTSKVEAVLARERKLRLRGINVAKKHLKPSAKNPRGGVISINVPLDASSVRLICSHCNKPTRIKHAVKEGKKWRICQHCGERIDYGKNE